MAKKKAKFNKDGWSNAVTGVGTGKDKGSYAEFTPNGKVPYNTLEHLYEGDWIIGKMCDTVPYEMTRKWITYDTALEPKKVEELEDMMTDFDVQGKFKEALTWARLYGGSAIMMVVNDGKEPDEPLDYKNAKELLNLIVLDAKTIHPKSWNDDIESKDYGKPEIYQFSTLNGKHKTVHTSRLLKFYGLKVSQRSSRRYRGWGASIISRTLQTVKNSQMLDAGVATLVSEAKYDTIYIPNLTELLMADSSEELVNLYSNINMQKSITNSVLLDAEMKQERTAYQFGGISEIQKNQLTNLATAIDIPEFILVGRNNGGLNAGQKELLLSWYDKILSFQETEMTMPLQQLLEVMGVVLKFQKPTDDKKSKKDADKKDDKGKLTRVIGFEFTSLFQLNPQEMAQVKSQLASADASYIREGVVTAEEVRKDLMQNKYYTNLDEDKEADDELPDPEADEALIAGMQAGETPEQAPAPQTIIEDKPAPVTEPKKEATPKDESVKKDNADTKADDLVAMPIENMSKSELNTHKLRLTSLGLKQFANSPIQKKTKDRLTEVNDMLSRADGLIEGYITFKSVIALKNWAKKGLKLGTYGRVRK